MRPMHLSTAAAVCLLASAVSGQLLKPGTYVGITLDAVSFNSGSSTVQAIDPFAKTATPIVVKGLPATSTEGPDSVLIESSIQMLIGSRSSAATASGNIYRATFRGSAWSALKLNTGPTGVQSIGAMARLGNTIYWVGSASTGSTGSSTVVFTMPSAGGKPTLYVDVGKAGSTGLGNAMTAVGKVLHVFTFDSSSSTTSLSEHWKIDTSASAPKAVKVGAALPKTKVNNSNNFAVVQSDYDARSNLLVIAGVSGDILWRDLNGKDIRHVLPGGSGNTIDSMALNTDTGTVGIGDRAAHYEELRCGEVFLANHVTMPSPVISTARVSNLAYIPAQPKYLPVGAGCAASNNVAPCNYVNSLPAAGNSKFTMTLRGTTKQALLIIGVKQQNFDMAIWGAPGCKLLVSLDVLVPGAITSTGAALGPVSLPSSLAGTKVFTQWLMTDNANAFGVVASDARQLEIK